MALKYFAVLIIAAVASADRSLEGVDPNSVSCDPEGLIALLLPSRTDCNVFYMCTHGKEVLFRCATPDLIFDFEQQTCAWPWSGTCTLRSNEDDEDEGSGSGSGYEPSINYEEEDKPAIHDGIINCGSIEAAPTQVVYRGDCQRYWRCINGSPRAVYCSDGLYFNSETQQCDFEANVKCHVEQEDELQGEFIVYK